MQFLAIVKLVIQLLPMLTDLVSAAEAMFPQAGSGAQKLAVVKSTLQTAYSTANGVEGEFEQVWPTLNGAITNIVAGVKAIRAGAAAQVAP